jgi:hypothetical protein
LVTLVALSLTQPVFAQVSLSDKNGTQAGNVKGLQILGTTDVAKSGGIGVIDISNFVPTAGAQVLTIVATTDTAGTPSGSIGVNTGTSGAKVAAIRISYTGPGGTQNTGWIRVYADGN